MTALGRLGPEFDDFVRGSAPSLIRTAALLVGDRAEAEDLVQTALLRTGGHWSRARHAPTAYARRVLVNLAKDGWRNRSRRPRTLSSRSFPEPVADATEENLLLRDELLGALAELPSRQRAVLVLRFLEDLPAVEVARIVGCSEGTVRSQTHHALGRMRTILARIQATSQSTEVNHVQ